MVDVETTGLGRADRVVEAAVIVLDEDLRTVEEFDTLIDPGRDVGPTGIHGITAGMVSSAPTFMEVGGAIAAHLDGCALVAHNLPFDLRMLAQEFARAGSQLDEGFGFDTLRYMGCSLDRACASMGIPLANHHRALADAQATADLFRLLHDEGVPFSPATIVNPPSAEARTLRREAVQVSVPAMARVRPPLRLPTGDGRMLAYLHALNWVLDDAVIDRAEREELDALARELGLDPVHTTQMHSHYMRLLVQAATRDGMVTRGERDLLDRVAAALGVHEDFLPSLTAVRAVPPVTDGMRVCFTGDAAPWTREALEIAAAQAGFQPVAGVTKKACDLVVAVDVASQSGKAAKARQWGIPIISVTEFRARVGLN
ncbi:MAG: exonuclease domain-containing protein [Dehalococcoidia bacterium]